MTGRFKNDPIMSAIMEKLTPEEMAHLLAVVATGELTAFNMTLQSEIERRFPWLLDPLLAVTRNGVVSEVQEFHAMVKRAAETDPRETGCVAVIEEFVQGMYSAR